MNRAPPKVPFKEQYKTQPKPQVKAQPKPQVKAQPKPQVRALPKPQVKAQPKPQVRAISSKIAPKQQPRTQSKKRNLKNNINKQKVAVWTGGPAMWKELHLRTLNWNFSKNNNDIKYLKGFGYRLPKFEAGCKCRSFYNKYLKSTPPTFNKYFEWTVGLHNAVNKKLGKPLISLEVARNIWVTK